MAVRPKDLTIAGPYQLSKFLGEGSFGVVKLGTHIKTGEQVAVKIIAQSDLTKNEKLLRRVEMEVNILRLIDHPCVTKYIACFQTVDHLFIILEYMEGGDLYELLRSKGSKGLPMEATFRFFYCILSGLEYCHSCCISHRDLKLENILLDADKEYVKLSDFGMANLAQDNMMETSCGSPHYAAPEVIRGQKYNGTKSDVWGLAVLLFVMCAGRLPFDSQSIPRVLDKVCEGQYTMPSHFGGSLRHLLSRMFVVPTEKRYSIKDVKRHPWFLGYCNKLGLDPNGYHHPDAMHGPRRSLTAEGFGPVPGDFTEDLNRLHQHPSLTCSIEGLEPMEKRSKFQDLQVLGNQLVKIYLSKRANTPSLAIQPEDMQVPIPEPFDMEILEFITLCQGFADTNTLESNLKGKKPTIEKAFYKLLQQQKQTTGSLGHLNGPFQSFGGTGAVGSPGGPGQGSLSSPQSSLSQRSSSCQLERPESISVDASLSPASPDSEKDGKKKEDKGFLGLFSKKDKDKAKKSNTASIDDMASQTSKKPAW